MLGDKADVRGGVSGVGSEVWCLFGHGDFALFMDPCYFRYRLSLMKEEIDHKAIDGSLCRTQESGRKVLDGVSFTCSHIRLGMQYPCEILLCPPFPVRDLSSIAGSSI